MKVILLNDPILRRPTDPVIRDELDCINSIVPDMTKLMDEEEGTGLAANQVGISMRFCIIKKDGAVKLLINPEILSMTDVGPFEEGCLSIPGTSAITDRAFTITLKYLDESFNEIQEEYKGIDAIVVQHEVDHLDGKLYVDQLQPMRKSLVLARHKKFLKNKGRV